ncbi:hypothetical protein OUZ56_006427 [Daphnia magna]|uniref:Uncharacterized protein n=1 Tax=Daphnia magna TaxID=35525 RepID=A0ABQ9YVL6_9CRUS|nr:hypothetical protein OUZ56_006427 [Daphnia magna]
MIEQDYTQLSSFNAIRRIYPCLGSPKCDLEPHNIHRFITRRHVSAIMGDSLTLLFCIYLCRPLRVAPPTPCREKNQTRPLMKTQENLYQFYWIVM